MSGELGNRRSVPSVLRLPDLFRGGESVVGWCNRLLIGGGVNHCYFEYEYLFERWRGRILLRVTPASRAVLVLGWIEAFALRKRAVYIV